MLWLSKIRREVKFGQVRSKIRHMLKLDAVIKLLQVFIGYEIYLQQLQ